jgi:hypothetical protein
MPSDVGVRTTSHGEGFATPLLVRAMAGAICRT